MINVFPAVGDIVNGSATATTAGIVTIPAGRWLTADVQISASVIVAAAATPRINYTWGGSTTGAAPANGSTLARLSLNGLVTTAIVDSNTTEIMVYGGTNGCTIDFNVGGASTASCVINGFLI